MRRERLSLPGSPAGRYAGRREEILSARLFSWKELAHFWKCFSIHGTFWQIKQCPCSDILGGYPTFASLRDNPHEPKFQYLKMKNSLGAASSRQVNMRGVSIVWI